MRPKLPRPTHFLCIPLITPVSRSQLASSLASFQADITSSFNVPQEAVRPLGTIHLTLGVMSFHGDEGKEKQRQAVELLGTLRPDSVSGSEDKTQISEEKAKEKRLTVALKGLKSFQPAKEARVLYAGPVDEFGVMQSFCERLRGMFIEKGLMRDEGRPLLLHATIVNMTYAKSRQGKNKSLDAREILERYEEYKWMDEVAVDKVQICKMGAKELDDGDSEYEAIAEVLL